MDDNFDPWLNYKAMNIVIDADKTHGALWLGDYHAAENIDGLKLEGIKTVLTVASDLEDVIFPPEHGINQYTYDIVDDESADISKIWNDTYKRIDEGLQKGAVLVHCAAGVSRSASTVIAYIMRKRGQGLNETINFVRSRRAVIHPNPGFLKLLESFERELKQTQQPIQKQFAPNTQKSTTNPPVGKNQQKPNKVQMQQKIQLPTTTIAFVPEQSSSTNKQKLPIKNPITKQTVQKTNTIASQQGKNSNQQKQTKK